MSDLTTKYMGLTLTSPLVASASPLCKSTENIGKLEDQGIAAVVLPSLFEEQLVLESLHVDEDLSRGSDSFPEALSFFPDLQTYNLGPHGYLELIRAAKARVSIPVIASLNGVTSGGWIEYARLMQEAGADAIELNIYSIATDPMQSAELIEKRYLDLVTQVKQSDSSRRQAVAVLQRACEFWQAPVRSGRRRPRAVQPLLPARFRH